MQQAIYKILTSAQWLEAQSAGELKGAPVDLADGYIHFSTAEQLRETAAKHFAGQSGLVLLVVDAGGFGGELKWETSRGGDLFPHLYAPLAMSAIIDTAELPLDARGRHVFSPDIP